MSTEITWKLSLVDDLSPRELLEMLKLRQEVFIVEQDCVYPDIDGKDEHCHHLLGIDANNENKAIACLRIVPPGKKYEEPSLGRIVVSGPYRGQQIGKTLILEGIRRTQDLYGQTPIRIEAQAHLQDFYRDLGFRTETAGFDVDGIPHVEMVFDGEPEG